MVNKRCHHEKVENTKPFSFSSVYISVSFIQSKVTHLLFQKLLDFAKENLHPFRFFPTAFMLQLLQYWPSKCRKDNSTTERIKKEPSHSSSGRDLCCTLYRNLWVTSPSQSDSFCAVLLHLLSADLAESWTMRYQVSSNSFPYRTAHCNFSTLVKMKILLSQTNRAQTLPSDCSTQQSF